jgi:hypothetical protein
MSMRVDFTVPLTATKMDMPLQHQYQYRHHQTTSCVRQLAIPYTHTHLPLTTPALLPLDLHRHTLRQYMTAWIVDGRYINTRGITLRDEGKPGRD